MGKPRLIIIVRHGQSEGNKNRDIHQTVPDHRVKLTHEGWLQAYDAGRRLRAMLRADDTVQFFTSPYQRTRETTRGILQTLTSDAEAPSPFKMSNIKVYEEPRLREQDFGNFQPCSAEMERMWQERADYGHFFYRIPNGESAADAYDRVSGFNESLWRQFGDDDFPSVCVLVTHGLMSRVFLMKWYHFSVEYFEDLRNINHCEFLIMRKDGQKYQLETKLRTWSELRRERAALAKEKTDAGTTGAKETDKDGAKLEKAASLLTLSGPVSGTSVAAAAVPPRRWGGCPNGCDHDKDFKIRPGLADLIKRDGTNVYEKDSSANGSTTEGNSTSTSNSNGNSNGNSSGNGSAGKTGSAVALRMSTARRFQQVGYSDDDGDDEIEDDGSHAAGGDGPAKQDGGHGGSSSSSSSKNGKGAKSGGGGGGLVPPNIDVQRAWEEMVSSPDATPSFIVRALPADLASPPPPPPPPPQPAQVSSSSSSQSQPQPALAPPKHRSFVHVGRDFGGTYSGHTSDADSSEDDRVRRRMARLKLEGGSSSAADAGADADADADADTEAATKTTTTTTTATAAAAAAAATASNGKTTDAAAKAASAGRRKRAAKNMANRLGDCSDPEEAVLRHGQMHDEADDDLAQDLADAEKQDRSVQGSVY